MCRTGRGRGVRSGAFYVLAVPADEFRGLQPGKYEMYWTYSALCTAAVTFTVEKPAKNEPAAGDDKRTLSFIELITTRKTSRFLRPAIRLEEDDWDAPWLARRTGVAAAGRHGPLLPRPRPDPGSRRTDLGRGHVGARQVATPAGNSSLRSPRKTRTRRSCCRTRRAW